MLQIIQKTYEGANLLTPASGVIALFALNGGTIKNLRVKVDADVSGATRFNLSLAGENLFTTELTIPEDADVISLTGLEVEVERFDRLILNLETVSAGGVASPIALQVESDEAVLISQSDIYDAVKAIVLAGTNVTRTANDGAKTLSFSTDGGAGFDFAALADALVEGDNISIEIDEEEETITISATGGSSGEANTGSNVGAGAEVFKDKSGVDLRFRTFVAGENVSVTETTNEIEIAVTSSGLGLAHGVDKPPASPPDENDEFDSSTLDAKWTKTTAGTAPTDSLCTEIDSYFLSKFGAADGNVDLTQALAPGSSNFSITAKFSAAFIASTQSVYVYVADSGFTPPSAGTGNWVRVGMTYQTAYLHKYSSFAEVGSSSLSSVYPFNTFFLHIQRISGTWTGWYSFDGISFFKISNSDSSSFTVAKLCVSFNQVSATEKMRCAIDWIRRDWITL